MQMGLVILFFSSSGGPILAPRALPDVACSKGMHRMVVETVLIAICLPRKMTSIVMG
jgi:hypothetical protein